MPQVFISYARQDVDFVDTKLIPLFRAMRIDVWVDREDLHASDVWEKRIEEALVGSEWYVLVMSERAAASRNVRKEVEWIIRHRPKRLFPILLEDCRPEDIHDVLPKIHYIDYKQAPARLGVRLLRDLVQGAWQAFVGEREKVEQLSAKIEEAAEERDELQEQVHELTGQLHDVSEFDGDWLGDGCGQAVDFVPRQERNASIVSVLNLKGGVGKSTLAVNLAATYFLRESKPKRVLIVDLDFQTSASTLCLHSQERKDAMQSRLSTSRLLDDDDPCPRLLFECAKRIGRTPGFIVAGDDGLARQENKVLARWLTKEGRYDARFLLRRILHSPEVQAQFDLIILDCPPRLHVAAVNAVAASDFVLVPVLLDLTSADSVPRLLSWLVRFRREGLCPDLELLGVVANKKSAFRKTLLNREHNVAAKLAETSTLHWPFGPVPLLESVIPDSAAVSDSAETPGRFACQDSRIGPSFQKLAKEIETRLFTTKEVIRT